jgi:hypothetical protein
MNERLAWCADGYQRLGAHLVTWKQQRLMHSSCPKGKNRQCTKNWSRHARNRHIKMPREVTEIMHTTQENVKSKFQRIPLQNAPTTIDLPDLATSHPSQNGHFAGLAAVRHRLLITMSWWWLHHFSEATGDITFMIYPYNLVADCLQDSEYTEWPVRVGGQLPDPIQ